MCLIKSGLWDVIKSDPLPWVDVFCSSLELTRSFFLDEVEILYSPKGCNRRKRRKIQSMVENEDELVV